MARTKQAPKRKRSFFSVQNKKNVEKTVKKRKPPGYRALREIKYLTQTYGLLIPKFNFQRVVREIMQRVCSAGIELRIQQSALEALQEATEMYIVQFFEDCQLASIHAKRVTLMLHDMHLIRRLRGRVDGSCH